MSTDLPTRDEALAKAYILLNAASSDPSMPIVTVDSLREKAVAWMMLADRLQKPPDGFFNSEVATAPPAIPFVHYEDHTEAAEMAKDADDFLKDVLGDLEELPEVEEPTGNVIPLFRK